MRRHKPAPEAYQSVAAALNLDPGDICLVASHVWDTIGAGAAGWQAGLILREGNAPLAVGPQPVHRPGLGLTIADLYALLRGQGVDDLGQVGYLLYETRGATTLIPADAEPGSLTRDALSAAGFADGRVDLRASGGLSLIDHDHEGSCEL